MSLEAIIQHIENSKAEFITLRRDLHQHPETGFNEYRTSDIVAQKLSEWGYQLERGLAGTGIVATLQVGDGKKILGLRADMDALPMQESSGKPWSSQQDNKFHGCGHDGHTAMLLCAAEYLAKTRNFVGTLRLIFQPAEELLYGGKRMLDDGLFTRFPCDHIFALHNMPGLKAGAFHVRKGAMMASSDTVHITVTGKGGHGAMPERSVDALLVACHIVIALQSIVSRNVPSQDAAVVTVGSLQSGEAPNIINASALLKLSLRSLDPTVRAQLLKRVSEIAIAQAQSFGATAEISHINGSPVLVNDAWSVDFAAGIAETIVSKENVCTDAHPVMGSEDFAFMLEANPNGCYLMLGAGDEPDRRSVHHPGYDFNDNILSTGAVFWCQLAERYLA